jgi:hypothetical protein
MIPEVPNQYENSLPMLLLQRSFLLSEAAGLTFGFEEAENVVDANCEECSLSNRDCLKQNIRKSYLGP